MRVYLDFNIFASTINQDFSIEQLLSNVGIDSDVSLPYSSAHIFEIENITANTPTLRADRISEYLTTFELITKGAYLYRELPSNNILLLQENPFQVYETITKVGNIKPIFNGMMSVISEEQKNQLRYELGIDKKEINNYKTEDVIKHLDNKSSVFMGMSCIEMIEYAVKLHPNGKEFSLHNRFAGIFELLDMFGYWTDKPTPKSNVARLWDSSHCYFASFCDYFISDDKRTRNKAKVVFDLYDIKTKILSSKGD